MDLKLHHIQSLVDMFIPFQIKSEWTHTTSRKEPAHSFGKQEKTPGRTRNQKSNTTGYSPGDQKSLPNKQLLNSKHTCGATCILKGTSHFEISLLVGSIYFSPFLVIVWSTRTWSENQKILLFWLNAYLHSGRLFTPRIDRIVFICQRHITKALALWRVEGKLSAVEQ